ncbi:hypothetical protein F2Q69_00019877 [Brassica cretica]|uniref:RING-type E3 ubiquitin transferase n=1 Tax=Brassica cretica TaxID=69181 RepID=A0A8S9Q0Y8_BRACR|nr:hypothetical protein F2Q69_00019877 [Brassica cretica]
MHTDMSCITIVDQDDIGGLQVRTRDGIGLMDINPKDEALVVNVGDLLHAWTNGRLRSSQHRVVLKRHSFVENRFSLAFFWCFEDQKVVFAPDEVVGGGERGRVFRSFKCGDYLRFRESNEKGKFEKVGHTVEDFARTEDQIRAKDRPDLEKQILPVLENLKKVAEKARKTIASAPKQPPSHFICPLLKDVMKDPCIAADGYTYDRKAIEKWMEDYRSSPVTDSPLENMTLLPNHTLHAAIVEWCRRNQ